MISGTLALSIILSSQLSATASGYTITLSSERGTQEYDAPEVMWLAEKGEPNVPSYVYKVGIPQNGTVEVTVANTRERVVRDTLIEPVIYPGIYEPPVPEVIDPFGDVYKQNAFYPEKLIEVSEPGYFRDIRVVTVRVNPVRYNPVTQEARVVSTMTIAVRFTGAPQQQPTIDTSFDRIYERTIVNYEQCKTWRRDTQTPQPLLQNPFATGVWYKIEVDSEGLYTIGYEEIQAAGIDPAQFDPHTMKIFTAAFDLLSDNVSLPFADSLVQVPSYVKGEEDNSFDHGDYLLFYAFAASHFTIDSQGVHWYEHGYARNNVYWFTFGGEFGERMERVQAAWNNNAPDDIVFEVIHEEEDRSNPTRSGINWYWLPVSPGSGPSASIAVPVQHLRARGSADIAIALFTLQSGSFIYRCDLDGTTFIYDTLYLSSRESIPPHYLRGSASLNSDSSTMTFSIQRPSGTATNLTAYFNSIDLQYERSTEISTAFHALYLGQTEYSLRCTDVGSEPFVFDITDTRKPRMLDNYTHENNTLTLSCSTDSFQLLYFSKYDLARPVELIAAQPGRLRVPAGGCEYLVITHENFYNAIMPLVDHRGQDYATHVVKVHDIYDDFSYGRYEPLAIKHFLYYAYNNWTIVPTFVLIVGDATYDYKNNLGKPNPPNFVPMYEWGTHLAGNPGIPPNEIYDGAYVNFGSGEVMVLGRTTVRTVQEVRDFIDKVITYETQDIDGMWNSRILLVGDDEWSNTYNWETPSLHCGPCEAIEDTVPDSLYSIAKVYMISYEPFVYPTTKPTAQEAYIKELNKGAYAAAFFGHGNTHQLADEVLFFHTDIPRIKNGRKHYFHYYGSCTVGRFDDSDFECIGEQMVRIKDGAVGTMAATAGCSPSTNTTIGKRLFKSMTDPTSNLTMGEHGLLARDGHWSAHDVLLGDPATKMRTMRQGMQLAAAPDSVRPLEELTVMTDQGKYYLAAFVRDADTIDRFNASTADKIAGYVYRLVQVGTSSYVPFGYKIDGKEMYRGYWDDTATVIVPQVSTAHSPVIKVYGHTLPRGMVVDSTHVYGSAAPSSDETGPEVTLYAGGRRLHENDWVEEEFTLTGKVVDESGINLMNSIESNNGFFLYINNNLASKIDLRDHFVYDRNSFTSGEFSVDVSFPESENTVTLNVADNYYNQTNQTVTLRVEQHDQVALENFLIYPNPLTNDGSIWFTFDLTNAGTVDIKIYTIAGRLIKTIEDVSCQAGYNQIHWDVLDNYMDEISNGVYLVKAIVSSGSAADENVERFVIAR